VRPPGERFRAGGLSLGCPEGPLEHRRGERSTGRGASPWSGRPSVGFRRLETLAKELGDLGLSAAEERALVVFMNASAERASRRGV